MKMRITVAISPGELLDKISILEIKSERIKEREKLKNVNYEKEILLQEKHAQIPPSEAIDAAYRDLKAINEKLWEIEDAIRLHEARGTFDQTFIALARAVYLTNDRRAEIKRRINETLHSDLSEEKYFTRLDNS
jgi:hypothetical protein